MRKPVILHGGRHISAEAGIEQNEAMIPSALESLDESSYCPRPAQTPGIASMLFRRPACGTCRGVARRLPEAAPAEGAP